MDTVDLSQRGVQIVGQDSAGTHRPVAVNNDGAVQIVNAVTQTVNAVARGDAVADSQVEFASAASSTERASAVVEGGTYRLYCPTTDVRLGIAANKWLWFAPAGAVVTFTIPSGAGTSLFHESDVASETIYMARVC